MHDLFGAGIRRLYEVGVEVCCTMEDLIMLLEVVRRNIY